MSPQCSVKTDQTRSSQKVVFVPQSFLLEFLCQAVSVSPQCSVRTNWAKSSQTVAFVPQQSFYFRVPVSNCFCVSSVQCKS